MVTTICIVLEGFGDGWISDLPTESLWCWFKKRSVERLLNTIANMVFFRNEASGSARHWFRLLV
jgi:hypothetical protein